ncbi:16757_t:CDS:2 [Gigaspora margarita]|uniref:16757_t:CDS:1 n=1 Tax=Gigaspora margarita TaxID=4874 RepID=A0ABM8VX85_GIGMA|nr:16757_t:CDS:2 [Gigaspora margarita]
MTFAFTNYTDKDMIVMGDTSTNYMEDTFTNHMKRHFTNYMENTFTCHMDTNSIWNTPTGINYSEDAFLNYIENTFTNGVMQMNASNTLAANEDAIVDKDMRMNKSIEVSQNYAHFCFITNYYLNDINFAESDVNSYEAIQDTANFDNMNDENCEIFSWSSLPDFLQAIFPSNYSYMIQRILKLPLHYTYEGFEIQQFEVDAFVNVSTVEDIKKWFSAFEEHSKTTMPQTKDMGSKASENTDCAASLSLRLERQHLNSSHPLEVHVCFKHNHIVNCTESLSFRRVHEEIRNKFIQMFHDSYSPASALYTYQDELHLSALSNKNLVETFAGCAINPDYTYVVHLFENYRNSQLGGQNGTSMFQRLNEEVLNYNASGCGRAIQNASASFEPLNTLITLLYTSCVAGALPLGLFVTSDELELTIEKAINLLKLILPKHAFFGRGCNVGPQNILIDDSVAERNAVKICWPQSNLLLCTFHILQAFWRWLYNSKHGISKEHRVTIMSQMKKILYAYTESDLNNYYQELKVNYYQQYPLFAKYYERLWNRRQHWAHYIIFARTKAYNSVQVFYFITKNMERFYERQLYGFAHRHFGHMEISKRFFCPGWETVDKDSIRQLEKTEEYLVPSTKKESGRIYNVNSAIGTCNCFIGMSGAPCKHQGAVAMKYHIRIINFLPSLMPIDHMIFSYIANGLHVKDYSFYASLRTKSALINQYNSINGNEDGDLNTIPIAESKAGASNKFSEMEAQEAEFDNSFFNKFLASEAGTSNELSEIKDQEVGFDSSSFTNFLKEIEDDYKNCGLQLQAAFDKFAERYKAAKSQSIGRVSTFLYDHNLNSARIRSGATIKVQPESVKWRKANVRRRVGASKENDPQEIPKCKARKINKTRHSLSTSILNNTLN